MRVSQIEIAGKTYPMCLTLKVAREMDERYDGLENIGAAFSEKRTGEMLDELLFLLGALLEGGRDYTRLSGGEEVQPPRGEELECLFGMDDLAGLKQVILSGLAAGAAQTVEAEPDPKNVDATGSSPSRGISTTPSGSD